jgi:hypothetical protein
MASIVAQHDRTFTTTARDTLTTPPKGPTGNTGKAGQTSGYPMLTQEIKIKIGPAATP